MHNITKITIATNIICCVAILFISIGYSSFTKTLTMEDILAAVNVETDIKIDSVSVSSTSENALSYGETHTNNAIEGTITLPLATSEIIYEVKVLNLNKDEYGILSINGLPEELDYNLIDYILEEKICEGSKCNLGVSKTLKIKLKYKEGKYNASKLEHNFKLEFDFRKYHKISYVDIPATGLPIEIIDGGIYNQAIAPEFSKDIEVKSGELVLTKDAEYTYNNNNLVINSVNNDITITNKKYQNGDYVKLGTEGFYVINANEASKELTMLAEWNLNVGENTIEVTPDQEGMQNEACKGWVSSGGTYNCTVAFSNTNYWDAPNVVYPTWVYNDNNDIVRPIVETYVSKLKDLGYTSVTGRLIQKDELLTLGCTISGNNCNSAETWLKNTSFWSGFAGSSTGIWCVGTGGGFGSLSENDHYNNVANYGVRPVITISTSDIK